MQRTKEDIYALIERGETFRLECKKAQSGFPSSLWESYSAFCNTDDKIVADVRKPFAIAKDGITRIDENEVHESIREVLANALIHADYHGRRGIVIEKRFRQIMFENPGCFRMSREDAVSGGRSDARNHLIFNIFALVEIGERSGHGLSNLFGVWDKYAFPPPVIRESYDPDRTTIKLTFDTDLLKTDPKISKNVAKDGVESSVELWQKLVQNLDNNQQQIG